MPVSGKRFRIGKQFELDVAAYQLYRLRGGKRQRIHREPQLMDALILLVDRQGELAQTR